MYHQNLLLVSFFSSVTVTALSQNCPEPPPRPVLNAGLVISGPKDLGAAYGASLSIAWPVVPHHAFIGPVFEPQYFHAFGKQLTPDRMAPDTSGGLFPLGIRLLIVPGAGSTRPILYTSVGKLLNHGGKAAFSIGAGVSCTPWPGEAPVALQATLSYDRYSFSGLNPEGGPITQGHGGVGFRLCLAKRLE